MSPSHWQVPAGRTMGIPVGFLTCSSWYLWPQVTGQGLSTNFAQVPAGTCDLWTWCIENGRNTGKFGIKYNVILICCYNLSYLYHCVMKYVHIHVIIVKFYMYFVICTGLQVPVGLPVQVMAGHRSGYFTPWYLWHESWYTGTWTHEDPYPWVALMPISA